VGGARAGPPCFRVFSTDLVCTVILCRVICYTTSLFSGCYGGLVELSEMLPSA
jgi:hypothetical protein